MGRLFQGTVGAPHREGTFKGHVCSTGPLCLPKPPIPLPPAPLPLRRCVNTARACACVLRARSACARPDIRARVFCVVTAMQRSLASASGPALRRSPRFTERGAQTPDGPNGPRVARQLCERARFRRVAWTERWRC
jgi:hypothetical protein